MFPNCLVTVIHWILAASMLFDVALPLTQVIAETTTGETIRYLHGLDLIAQSDGVNEEYLLSDGLGSVRQVVGGSGVVHLAQTFDPYGAPYISGGTDATEYGFTGEQTDANGLVYLRARYYNPSTGRFMQVDPSRMERNGYQYAGSSPGMYTDPSGYSGIVRCDYIPLSERLAAWLTGREPRTLCDMSPSEQTAHLSAGMPGPSMVVSPAIPLVTQGTSQLPGLVGRVLGRAASWEALAPERLLDLSWKASRGLGYVAPKLDFVFKASIATAILRDALGIQPLTSEDRYAIGEALFVYHFDQLSQTNMEFEQWLLNSRVASPRTIPLESLAAGRGGVLPHTSEIVLPNMASQELVNSCGPACARELLRRQGINLTEKQVIELIGSGRVDGLTGNWAQAAEGMNSVSPAQYTPYLEFQTPDEALAAARQLEGPWIAVVRQSGSTGHAVIVEGFQGGNLVISDPWPWVSTGQPGLGNAIQYTTTWDSFFQYWFRGQFKGLFPVSSSLPR